MSGTAAPKPRDPLGAPETPASASCTRVVMSMNGSGAPALGAPASIPAPITAKESFLAVQKDAATLGEALQIYTGLYRKQVPLTFLWVLSSSRACPHCPSHARAYQRPTAGRAAPLHTAAPTVRAASVEQMPPT